MMLLGQLLDSGAARGVAAGGGTTLGSGAARGVAAGGATTLNVDVTGCLRGARPPVNAAAEPPSSGDGRGRPADSAYLLAP